MANWSTDGRIATVLSTSYPGCSAHRFTFSPQFLFCPISPRRPYTTPVDGLRTRHMLRLDSLKSREIHRDGCGCHARPSWHLQTQNGLDSAAVSISVGWILKHSLYVVFQCPGMSRRRRGRTDSESLNAGRTSLPGSGPPHVGIGFLDAASPFPCHNQSHGDGMCIYHFLWMSVEDLFCSPFWR